ncbi:hypothetical protein JXB01_01015 [Candidatus Micrarchaeota archaeon]|nr:hypothetical protein [Candidatus Micrarchaeota archaeon]
MADIILGFLDNFREGGTWYMLCILAAFVALLINGLFLAIARAFQMQQFERYSLSEIMQVVATLLMVLIVFTLIDFSADFAVNGLIGAGSQISCGGVIYNVVPDTSSVSEEGEKGKEIMGNMYDIVQCKFMENANEVAKLQQTMIENSGAPLNPFRLKSMYIYILGIQVYNGNWNAAWYREVESYRLLNYFTTDVLMKINGVIIALKYMEENLLTVFLPVGLFLRCFQPTRGMGAFFIAFAFGFYFVFPSLFILTDPGFVNVPSLPEPAPHIEYEKSCFPTFSGTISEIKEAGSGTIISFGSISNAASLLSKFYLFMILHVFAVFSVTLILVRYLTYIFGGEAYTLMRFIARVV